MTTFTQPDAGWANPTLTGHAALLAATLAQIIRDGENNRPRTLQKAIGPSGVGEPCTRKLAYQLLAWEKANPNTNPLPSAIGTGLHALLAELFENRKNDTLPDGRPRWVVETRVTVRLGLEGNSDLFDRATGTVIDWKLMGKTGHDRLRKNGPSPGYRVQAHSYGLGFENAGEHVEHVAIAAFPRSSGRLSDLHVWTEPYDRAVAEAAMARMDNVLMAAVGLDIPDHPERMGLIPALPGPLCSWCSYYLPHSTDLGKGCPGA